MASVRRETNFAAAAGRATSPGAAMVSSRRASSCWRWLFMDGDDAQEDVGGGLVDAADVADHLRVEDVAP